MKQDGLGASVVKNSTASFFVAQVSTAAHPVAFRTVYWYRNQNSKNALNMSFGSNAMDWVRPLRKILLQVFLCEKCPERSSRLIFAQFFVPEPKLQKRSKLEFWVKRDGLGASVAKNSTASFFVPKLFRAAHYADFRTVFRTGTKTPKTR